MARKYNEIRNRKIQSFALTCLGLLAMFKLMTTSVDKSISSSGAHKQQQERLEEKKVDPCMYAKDGGIIVIPAVRKGLNNQRLRIIQDIAVAAFLKNSSVVLPASIVSRSACHYRASCYKQYGSKGILWDAFDEESTLQSLADAGICVHTLDHAKQLLGKLEGATTTTSTDIQQIRAPGHNPKSQPIALASEYERAQKGWLKPGLYQIGNNEVCCTQIIPDTLTSQTKLLQINAAFHSNKSIQQFAQKLIDKLNHITQNNNNHWLAMHWRGEDDFVRSTHALNLTAYNNAISDAFLQLPFWKSSLDNQYDIVTFILGDNVDIFQLKQHILNGIQKRSSESTIPNLVFHTKESLFPAYDWAGIFQDLDDVKGQVDFEVGMQAPFFLGTPFSSFSAIIALSRTARQIAPTRMIEVDVVDKLALIFAAQLPYIAEGLPGNIAAEQFVSSRDRCREALLAHPNFGHSIKCPSSI